MKMKNKIKLNLVVFTVFFLTSMLMCPLPEMNSLSVPKLMIGVQPASAAQKYGILGQTSPELNIDTWIDGNGKTMEPINLIDYRDKIVFLYFFQDW